MKLTLTKQILNMWNVYVNFNTKYLIPWEETRFITAHWHTKTMNSWSMNLVIDEQWTWSWTNELNKGARYNTQPWVFLYVGFETITTVSVDAKST